jgi:hypothetical protein
MDAEIITSLKNFIKSLNQSPVNTIVASEAVEDNSDSDYETESDVSSESEDESNLVEETIKVNSDEKGFMSLDLEYKKSKDNINECE